MIPNSATKAEIEAARTTRGGYNRDILAKWGVPWPPPKGWKKAIMKPEPKPGKKIDPPKCVECDGQGVLVTGEAIYPHRADLWSKSFYRCGCGAYVGCHPGTQQPLGTCAGAETRTARSNAHRVFDPIWEAKQAVTPGCSKSQARNAGYLWLATEMGLPSGQCHISWMTAAQARRVYAICKPIHDRIKGALRT